VSISRAAFFQYYFSTKNTFVQKSCSLNVGEIDTRLVTEIVDGEKRQYLSPKRLPEKNIIFLYFVFIFELFSAVKVKFEKNSNIMTYWVGI